MKQTLTPLLFLSASFAFITALQGIHHEHGETKHTIVTPDQLEWQDGPASLEAGAEFVVLEGDPGKEGMFTMRIRVPAEFRIAPHTHPKVERVTVLEGKIRFGMGRVVDEENMETLEAGSFFIMPPGMEHYVIVDEDTTIQLTSMGPWQIRYIDPADDPRRATE